MTAFINTFDSTGPVGTDKANNLDSFIRQDTKAALEERLALEHYSLEDGVNDDTAAGGQGRHKPGYVGAVLLDTVANIVAITGAGIGAMAIATDTGDLYINGASGWAVEQFGNGTIYATDAEAAAGLLENVAINPKQLIANIDTVVATDFTTPTAVVLTTIYEATTSGILVLQTAAFTDNSSIVVFSDSDPAPTVEVGHISVGTGGQSILHTLTVPIVRGNYYQVVSNRTLVDGQFYPLAGGPA